MVSKVMVHFLLLLYITSWKTLNLPYQSLQVSREVEDKCLSSGDEAYPLEAYLMQPFARTDVSCEECVFNYSLSRARRCVECAFGILTAK